MTWRGSQVRSLPGPPTQSETFLSTRDIAVKILMSQIRVTIVSIIALFILYFIYSQARAMMAPRNITLVMALMAVLILFNVARTGIRGY